MIERPASISFLLRCSTIQARDAIPFDNTALVFVSLFVTNGENRSNRCIHPYTNEQKCRLVDSYTNKTAKRCPKICMYSNETTTNVHRLHTLNHFGW